MSPKTKPLEKAASKKSVWRQRVDALVDQGVNFFNNCNPREKVMIIILAGSTIVFLDYWVLIHPVVQVFRNTLPELGALEAELQAHREDRKNQETIEQEWTKARQQTADKEKSFVAPDELPALLENLSKFALESGVKILSLKTGDAEEAGATHRYTRVPIHLSALAGTHEWGAFLSRLESDTTFFRVEDLKITAQPSDPKRHQVNAVLQVYRRLG